MERSAAAAGAVFEVRDGWNVAISYGATAEQEATAAARSAGWADVSHLGKLELQGPAEALDAIATHCGAALVLGEATRGGDAWWCRLTASRALVVGDVAPLRERIQAAVAEAERATVVDVSTNFAALTLTGPQAREVLARFCALDLRPSQTPVRGAAPRIDRAPAGDPHLRGRGPATCSCSAGRRLSTCGRSSPTPAATWAGGRSGSTPWRN